MSQTVPHSKKLQDAIDILKAINEDNYDRVCIALVKDNKLKYRFDIRDEISTTMRKLNKIMKNRVKKLVNKEGRFD